MNTKFDEFSWMLRLKSIKRYEFSNIVIPLQLVDDLSVQRLGRREFLDTVERREVAEHHAELLSGEGRQLGSFGHGRLSSG